MACAVAGAQPLDGTATVVITGSVAGRALADAPYAVSAVGREELRSAGALINLSEAVGNVPGLTVVNRWNFAQDLQISSRGFGARAGFGVRGLRLYTDGIPASGPDGQGQVSHFDLASAARVEVLRGPFSVLYGNSSGGVIALVSAPVSGTRVEAALDAGSFGLRQARLQGETRLGSGLDLRVGAAAMEIDGFRPHSAAKRRLATGSLGYTGEADTVRVSLNALDQPAQDPLGLTRAQFDADARQVTPQAEQFDTRKTTRQSQAGGTWQHRFGAGALRETTLALYSGRREVVQFLAIPAATQANARHGGAVIDFDRVYAGAEARARFGWTDLDLVLGLAADRQRDERKGYENFTGSGATQVLGVVGALRRDEIDRAQSNDAFAQLEWRTAPAVALSGGVRAGEVKLSAADAYLSNGDDSGSRRFDYVNPVLGVRWTVAPGLNLHAAWARGFESPTLGELAYRADGTGGFNTELQAQESEQLEVGAKWRRGAWQVDGAAFETRVADEIGVATNAGGRSSFRNVGRTLRRGAELAARWQATPAWTLALSATALEATYRDTFLVCAGVPCNTPNQVVTAGNRIAGTQRHSAAFDLAWRSGGAGQFGLELRTGGDTVVNDLNTDRAAGATVAALRWQHDLAVAGTWRLQWLLRVDNLFDRRYAGSVIVNDANGRFFETAAPRAVLLSLRLIGP